MSARQLDDALLVWIVPVAAMAAVPLLVGHFATLLVDGRRPGYPPSDAPGIMGRFLARTSATPGRPGNR